MATPIPTALDLELVPLAVDLLAEFGKSATLRISSANREYEVSSGEEGDPTPEELTVKITPPAPALLRYFKSDVAIKAETAVFIAGRDLATKDPSPEGEFVIDGAVWFIQGSQRFYSGEQIALWGFALGSTRV